MRASGRARAVMTVAFVAVLGASALLLLAWPTNDVLSDTFRLDGIFYEPGGYVEITFEDSSGGTRLATLEVLGMAESFQRTYTASEFAERIDFPEPPLYGWKVHPVTLVVQHDEHGMVGIKTEIRPEGGEVPPTIFGVP